MWVRHIRLWCRGPDLHPACLMADDYRIEWDKITVVYLDGPEPVGCPGCGSRFADEEACGDCIGLQPERFPAPPTSRKVTVRVPVRHLYGDFHG